MMDELKKAFENWKEKTAPLMVRESPNVFCYKEMAGYDNGAVNTANILWPFVEIVLEKAKLEELAKCSFPETTKCSKAIKDLKEKLGVK